MNRFVAIDGESYTVHGEHRYVLLCASTGRYLYDTAGIRTIDCFEFLLDEYKRQKCTLVAFGLNYDANMIFRDVDQRALIRLWLTGKVNWRGYRIEWLPSKWLAVSHKQSGRYFRVFDTFGFFQTSFVNALRKWEFEPPPEIEDMKRARSSFDESMRDTVIAYCMEECALLVRLMDELEIALYEVGLKLSSWVGAGAIASALLRKNGVKEHHSYDSESPAKAQTAIRRAYFGGRTELFRQGIFPHLWDYDISSAYPSEAMKLPTLKGEWRRVRKYDPALEFALWDCSWDLPPESLVMPFPFRRKGDIFYPSSGRGTYHAVEVREAMRHFNITVHGGWAFTPADASRPFQFISAVYDFRRELKANGHAGEKVLKLGMNAIYGKLAQGYGYNGKRPQFQSYYWAGRITAGTRARILRMAMQAPESLVMVATDGIFFDRDVGIEETPGLGGIELTRMDDVFVAQPGVYSAVVDGETVGRSRGFFSREIDFNDLRHGFLSDGPYYAGKYESTRFCGLGYVLIMRDFDVWRSWQTRDRKLSLYPSRKFLGDGDNGTTTHLPPAFDTGTVSTPYRPKESGVQLPERAESLLEFVQGTEQPLEAY